jgi:hypothetical protein
LLLLPLLHLYMRPQQQAILTHSSAVWHRQRATTERLLLVVATVLLLLLLAGSTCTVGRWWGRNDARCLQSIVHRDAVSCLFSMLLLLLVWVLQFSCMF